MGKSTRWKFILSVSIMLAACSSTPTSGPASATLVPIPPDWGYEKNAITVHIKADPQLNLFHKSPHTLLLCIYHLRDPNWFNQLQNEKDGLQKLLECSRSDPSVVIARPFHVQPGQEITEVLDRPEGARFVHVAAGYYKMQKDRATRTFPIPLSRQTIGATVVQKPQNLFLDLYLGPQEIQLNQRALAVQK